MERSSGKKCHKLFDSPISDIQITGSATVYSEWLPKPKVVQQPPTVSTGSAGSIAQMRIGLASTLLPFFQTLPLSKVFAFCTLHPKAPMVLSAFHKNPSKRSGLESQCKTCVSRKKAENYKKKRKKKATSLRHRSGTQMLTVDSNDFIECYHQVDRSFFVKALEEVVEALLCKEKINQL